LFFSLQTRGDTWDDFNSRSLSTTALKDPIAKITSTPIALAFDAVSLADTQQTAHDILLAGGTLINVTQPQLANKSENKAVHTVHGSFHPLPNREMDNKFMSVLTQWLADGTVKVCRTSWHRILDIHVPLYISQTSST